MAAKIQLALEVLQGDNVYHLHALPHSKILYRYLLAYSKLSQQTNHSFSKHFRMIITDRKQQVSKIIYVIGGFDTPSASASGYSTTSIKIYLFRFWWDEYLSRKY